MKNIVLVFAFACLAAPVFAQFSIGLSAGTSFSDLKWHVKPVDFLNFDYKTALGGRAALLGEWQISPLLGLRAEIGAHVKSSKLIVQVSDVLGEVLADGIQREHFQYWEGSLLAQVSPLKKFKNVYLLAGGTVGRLTNGWRTVSNVVFEGGGKKQTIDLKAASINRNAISADFGLGGNIPLGAKNTLKIEGRYQYSLTDFSTHPNVDANMSPLIFSVGYLHRL